MAKTPKEPKQDKQQPDEDEVLRRMLNTPPKPKRSGSAKEKAGPKPRS